MKTILWLVIGILVSGSVFGQSTNVWSISEKYERNCNGWVKGGSMLKGGMFGIEKTAGTMRAPSALRVRMKNANGDMEIKKTFNIPESEQGKEIVVEALIGYNFKNETGESSAFFSVKSFNKRGEMTASKEVSRGMSDGTLKGTSTDMEINRFVFNSDETKDVKTIQISVKAKAKFWDGMIAEVQRGKICMSELWIRSLTIKEQE